MKFKNILILSLVTCLVLGCIWWLDIREKTEGPVAHKGEDKYGRILLFDPQNVTKINLANSHGSVTVALENDVNALKALWRMSEPVRARADQASVSEFVGIMEWLIYGKSPAVSGEGIDLARYGFDAPRATVSIWIKNRKGVPVKHRILLGHDVPQVKGLSEVYMHKEGTKAVYAVSSAVLKLVEYVPDDFREKAMFTLAGTRVDEIVIELQNRKLHLAKTSVNKWRMKEPVAAWGQAGKIQELINRALAVTADRFVLEEADDLAALGLDPPFMKFSLTNTQTLQTQTLLVGANIPEAESMRYAKRLDEDAIVSVPTNRIRVLDQASKNFRYDKLLLESVTEVSAFEIQTPGLVPMAISKKDGAWQIASPVSMAADAATAQQFLQKCSDLAIQNFYSEKKENPASLGLDADALRIVFPDGQTIILGNALDETLSRIFAKRGEEDPIFIISGDILENLRGGYLAFRNRRIFQFDRDKVTEIALTRSDGLYTCRPTVKDHWQIASPFTAEADQSNLTRITWDLSTLRAQAFVVELASKPPLARYGLDKPQIKVRAHFTPDDKAAVPAANMEYSLSLGKKASNGVYYAMADNVDAIFTVAASVYKNLNAEIQDTLVFDYNDEAVTGLVIQAANKTTLRLTYKLNNAGLMEWQQLAPARKFVDEDLVQALLDKLDNLKVAKYAQREPSSYLGYGLENLKLTVIEGAKQRVFHLGNKAGDMFYIRNASDLKIGLIPRETVYTILLAASKLEPAFHPQKYFSSSNQIESGEKRSADSSGNPHEDSSEDQPDASNDVKHRRR